MLEAKTESTRTESTTKKPERRPEVVTITFPDLDGHIKYFKFDHDHITIDRFDDCRCTVTIKQEEIGVGGGLKALATLINLANEFYEAERRVPFASYLCAPF